MDVKITGADNLAKVAARVREVGDKSLKSELTKGINRATKPLREQAKKAAATKLPQSGGLAALVAKSKFTTKTLTGSNPAVRIMVKGTGLTTDKGFVKHRVFGTDVWVTQQVQGGWFTDTMREGAPVVQKELLESMDDVARKIDGGL